MTAAEAVSTTATQSQRSVASEALLIGAVYFALAWIAIHLTNQPEAITSVWFANAAAIAIVSTAAPSRWPLLLAVAATANVAADWAVRGNLPLSISYAPGNLIEVALGACLLRRFDLVRQFDASPQAFARAITAGALLPQLAGATIGSATLQWHGFASFEATTWFNWYIDAALGALATLPLALALRRAQLDRQPMQLATPASLTFLVVLAGTACLAFWKLHEPYVMLSVPLVASAFFITPTATFGLCFALVLGVAAGFNYHWIATPVYARPWHEVYLFLPLIMIMLPAQLLALIVARMRRFQTDTDSLTLVGNDTAALFDERGIFRGANRAYERMFGHEQKSLIGTSIEESVAAPYTSVARERFERARRGAMVQVRIERETALGPRVLDVNYQAVPDAADGRIGRVLLSAHDVTDLVTVQRELENNVERLRRANEGMQQFVRIASHDMREPLNTISQFCGLIETDHAHELTAPARLYFEQVGSSAKRMRTLLDDVLGFARVEDSAGVAVCAVALAGVVDTALAALRARITERQAQIDVVTPLPTVLGHESLLVLMIQNLVSNGIKFTPPERRPQVRISARVMGDDVLLTVADNGIGIAAGDQAELFTPFKRLHTRRQYDGTGLGLAISKRIVETLGGSIELESQAGAGTQLHVRLRRFDSAALGAAPAA